MSVNDASKIQINPKSLPPKNQGLYDKRHEKDSCGVGFVAHIKGKKSHEIVQQGLMLLTNLTHRGATGYDPKLGDGAGLLMQMPDAFMREEAAKLNIELPEVGKYAVGNIFLPQDAKNRASCEAIINKIIGEENQSVIGWRDVPVNNAISQMRREMLSLACAKCLLPAKLQTKQRLSVNALSFANVSSTQCERLT
jgi:glutamate synthase (NADPH) large chain